MAKSSKIEDSNNTITENILQTEYSDVMQKSFIDYSMSVITSRAVPDIRDGLKPVQRRVLYAMNELGLGNDKPHRKSARIVGDAMGKYHPHGDSSIYETLVVMSQDFKKEMPLVDGHGNFGSIEGDGAAAMRYTEARLEKYTQDVCLADIDKNVVDFVPNFDETEKEPEVLPMRVPNILINGSEGIAVGMTTSIPPHNLGEVIDAVKAYISNPKITTEELMRYMSGPDFPTGGVVFNKDELLDIYEKGVGKIKLRGKIEFEPGKRKADKDKLVITEIPYTMIGAGIGKFISDVTMLIEEKKLPDVTDISNESSKEGIRIVLELKKDADIDKIKNILYKKTKLEDTFGVNMLVISDGKPEIFGLKDIFKNFLKFRFEVEARKYKTLLKKEQENREIKEGLITACDEIDLIIEILRNSKNLTAAKACLTKGIIDGINLKTIAAKKKAAKLHFTEKQAAAILDMRLYKLAGLEVAKLKKEYEECLKRISEYEDVLGNKSSMEKVIKKDFDRIKKEYAVERRTLTENGAAAQNVEETFIEREIVFVMNRFGYVKVIEKPVYEKNKEVIDAENQYVLICKNTEKICMFTDAGMLHQIKVADIPSGKCKDKGVPIDNISGYSCIEETPVFVTHSDIVSANKLLFATKNGMVKITSGVDLLGIKKTTYATKLQDNDKVVSVREIGAGDITKGSMAVILETENSKLIKFKMNEISESKKNSIGVIGIQLSDDDFVKKVYLTGDTAIPDITLSKRGKRGK